MANFNLETDFNNAMKIFSENTQGPAMRWQRKMNDSKSGHSLSANASLLQVSLNKGSLSRSVSSSKLQVAANGDGSNKSTPSRSRTPTRNKTPNKTGGGDRFIPSRQAVTDFESAAYKFGNDEEVKEDEVNSPGQIEYKKAVGEVLKGEENAKILNFKAKVPAPPPGHNSNLRVLYGQGRSTVKSVQKTREIPQHPEKVLDAPELRDNYYLNLVDWSNNWLVAAALGKEVFIWNSEEGSINTLVRLLDGDQYISSVSWAKDGPFLAVGTSDCDVQIWDVGDGEGKLLRTLRSDESRVGSLSWHSHILSTGSRTGVINHHDVRVGDHLIGSRQGHTQEVCGLSWSPDGRYLASGGNDNLLNIWDSQDLNGTDMTQPPLYQFNQHQAAVKALAWCPWNSALLASGGGTADRCIKFWNCNNGTNLKSIDTGSQVCALQWSKLYREIISGHGFPNNYLTIWKYPNMEKLTDLKGHSNRVLHLSMSPDEQVVLSASADETIRLWRCFTVDQKKAKKDETSSTRSIFNRGIR